MRFPALFGVPVSSRFWRTGLVRRLLLALLLGFVWQGQSSYAVAGCGDYVIIDNPVLGPDLPHAKGLLTTPHLARDHTWSRDNPGPMAPCHGPECRQKRPVSPAVPTSFPGEQRHDAGTLREVFCAPRAAAVSWQNGNTDPAAPRNLALRIERPPR